MSDPFLNLSEWIERRKSDIGPYAEHIIHSVKAYEAHILGEDAKINRLTEFIEELRDFVPDIHSGRTSQDPRDDVPDVMDADVFLLFQEDAIEALGEKP